jgi:hypoxanthine phosphoribosyltransferase
MTDIVFTPFTHDEMVAGVHAIAAAAGEWAPTLLVGVGRGGLAPAVYLSHRLGLPVVSVDYSAKIEPFGEALIEVLARHSRKGDRLLFVEDINDSGKTITELRGALAEHGAVAAQIRFAVLLDNIRSQQRVDYRFREIDRSVTKDWFIFPWEAMASPEALAEDAQEVPERIA